MSKEKLVESIMKNTRVTDWGKNSFDISVGNRILINIDLDKESISFIGDNEIKTTKLTKGFKDNMMKTIYSGGELVKSTVKKGKIIPGEKINFKKWGKNG